METLWAIAFKASAVCSLGKYASRLVRRLRLITASVPVAVQLLPPVLARMRLSLPDIQVEVVPSNALSNLLRREADIALRMVRP
jgi:DNA-binding transcriptional LysR family regulator